jgi:S-adenosylmethionine-diacylglycerol 3-amino-3-carboxypropyl transferase
LRAELSDFARSYWDRNSDWFCQKHGRDTFYYFGLSGLVARAFRATAVRLRLRGDRGGVRRRLVAPSAIYTAGSGR